ncbi:alpha-ketoglutarate-dependent dioxygenase alkB homolog 4 [Neodiprion lecontei]|uniref:Alpha-ketoglutarate-dependent dioxygenase alkB homolog 4 n=1 Tax=Neodiprion lecontei TaxID=441921 RepID=A0A6J0BRK6_NEOLC|nr:alpha-ketoglutarate-dependent dioxygenase alkB homolog 4 [Neodiprion lecontei]
MEIDRSCGCKGIRSCLICETIYRIPRINLADNLQNKRTYVYCINCDKAWPGWNLSSNQHPNHIGVPIDYPGVYIEPNFLSKNKAKILIKKLDELPWDLSQSGRRKQNYGPKCNFKRRRLRLGNFSGFPATTRFVQEKFANVPLLQGFQTIEQCSLEYDPLRGASIDPHIDDCWIWGERIITVNITGDAVLTMTPYTDALYRYNLPDVETYPSVVESILNSKKTQPNMEAMEHVVVRLPMPARSLMVLYGASRYNWEHAVLREDVKGRRLCIAYREFTPPYLEGGDHFDEGSKILEKARIFW